MRTCCLQRSARSSGSRRPSALCAASGSSLLGSAAAAAEDNVKPGIICISPITQVPSMASEGARARRTNLLASRVHWSPTDIPDFVMAQDQKAHGNSSQDSVRKWLSTAVTEEDAKREPLREAAEPQRRNPSGDDDLALGVDASLYGNQGVRTVQEFLRWSRSDPALSRWNSFSSATSGHSGPLSVMDILNLWNDDPEEVLLDLGFGCDEPDLSGRIPARFINHQSQARGINLQVFLEAQKNRLDLENPDVNNRFRQLEVLQQVTTAFSSLVGPSSSSSSALNAPLGKDLSPEARERRSRVGMLFRRASKKSLSQIHNQTTPELAAPADTLSPRAAPESAQPPSSLGDRTALLKRVKPGETVCLSPLAEEQGAGADPQAQPNETPLTGQEEALRLRQCPLREGPPLTASTSFLRKRSPGPARESFEMEEIHSFDESSVAGSYAGAEHSAQGVIRTNSCQSDSSGFLEEPFIPSLCQQASPGPDLIKALAGLSEGSTDSQSSERPGSPSPPSPHTLPSLCHSSSPTSSAVDKSRPSPCPSPEPSPCSPSPSPLSLRLSKSDPQTSETESPPDQVQSAPDSLPVAACETELQIVTGSQSPTSPASCGSASPTSPPSQPAPLIKESEETETEDEDAPCPHLSTAVHGSEDAASVPPPSSSPPRSPNLDCQFSASAAMSPTQCSSSSWSPGDKQSEQNEVAWCENSPSASCGLSPLLPPPPDDSPSAPPYFDALPSSSSPSLTESLSQRPENNQNDSLWPHSDGASRSDPTTNTQEKETEPSLSSQLDEDTPSPPSSLTLDSSESDGCATLSCLSPHSCSPGYQSASSPPSHDSQGLIDPTAGGTSDLTEQQEGPCSDDHNTDPAPARPVQDVIHDKMNDLGEGEGEGEGERHTDTVQTPEAAVYVSDTESSAGLSERSPLLSEEVCNQTEIDLQVPSCSLHDELSTGTKPEECERGENSSERESLTGPSVLVEVEPEGLIKIESLDVVFQTSVDGSEGENEDVEAFFQQLDSEGRVYWAEPIRVSNPTPMNEESDGSPGGLDVLDPFLSSSSPTTTDTDQASRNAAASPDTSSSVTIAPIQPPSAPPHLKPSSRSVSVQMPSSLSSHIVHRKDVPYVTDSKRALLPSVLTLDTSTPFRAVQSWTDQQIQRNTLTKKLSHGALHAAPQEVTVSMSAAEAAQRPALNFSSSPYFPLLSDDWPSHDCLPGVAASYRTMSVSMDKGLWPDEEEEVDGDENDDEEKLWEGSQTATMACCCSCDHQHPCCAQRSYDKQHSLGNSPYSLDELEEMMLCLQQFRSVLSNMEEQLSEDQAAVYGALSDEDREKIRDIEELRRAVRQEVGELETQLSELAHHYDDSLKMKMHRLLDEQSLLCSQLRIFLPASSSPAPNRTVATQCCLLPWIPPADQQSGQVSSWSTWNVDSLRQSPAGSKCTCEGVGCSPTKADKLDMMSFLQRLKESLRHSVNTDSLE